MSDCKRRIKTIEKQLDLDRGDETINVYPAKHADETEAEYKARMAEPLPPGYIHKTITYGNFTITMPAAPAGGYR